MPTFFSDPSPNAYLYFAIAAIVCLVLWFASKWRLALVLACTALAWLVLLFVCDRLLESPREQAVRKMQEIAKLTKEKKLDEAFSHLSDSFTLGAFNKKALQEFAKRFVNEIGWGGVDVDNFDRKEFEMLDDNRVRIGFTIRPGGPFGLKKEYNFYCRGTFVKEPDGQFRLREAELFRERPGPGVQAVVPEELR